MTGNRALYMDTRQYSYNQHQLRIWDHAPWRWEQWWVFDRRTKTIRNAHKRNLAISREVGVNRFFPGGNAVVRQWTNTVYHRSFYNKNKMVQDWGNFVLTPHSWANNNGHPLTWWWAKNHAGQKWRIDRQGLNLPKYPIGNGILFQIKSRMAGNRALFWHEHIGGGQYRLRIRNNASYNDRQWFVFDSRTQTIRASADRRLALSN